MRKIIRKLFLSLMVLSLASGCGGKKAKEEAEFIYAFKETFIVNLAKEADAEAATPSAFLKVRLGLGVSAEAALGEIGTLEFKVRDRVNYILSRQTLRSIATDSGKDNVKREVREALNKFLNAGEVKDVFFYEFVTQ